MSAASSTTPTPSLSRSSRGGLVTVTPEGPPWLEDPTEPHAIVGVHAHAVYFSQADYQARLDAAAGAGAPVWVPGVDVPPVGGQQ